MQAKHRWRWAAASSIGTSHKRLGTRKQDAFGVRLLGSGAFCVVVSDGAGSASHGGEGATLVCRHLLAKFKSWFLENQQLPTDDVVQSWIDDLRDLLSAVAARRELTRRQFAATLVMLVVFGEQILTLQIGDSALVGRRNGTWEALCWPENGEFASTTFFVTDDPSARLHIVRSQLEHDAFAVFSDGLDSVALEHARQQPYARFFDPMIKPVDATEGIGKLVELSASLAQYLESPRLCERTDDDKTLVLISRR